MRFPGNTAAEIIYNRADHKKEHMGLTSWEGAPNGKIHKYDVVIAKNSAVCNSHKYNFKVPQILL